MNSKSLSEKQINELKKLRSKIKEKPWNVIKMTKKNKQKFFRSISFLRKEIELSNREIEDLKDKKILKVISEKEDRLTFSLKGLLMLEYGIMNPTNEVNNMLDSLNKTFFESIIKTASEDPLKSDEKAILIGLIGLHAFSEDYALKLNKKNKDYFRDAVDYAVSFIKCLGPKFDDGELDKIWSKNIVGEGPVLGKMRRIDKIQIHTEFIYKKVKNVGHYLDVLSNNEIDESKMTYLLKRIFDKKPLSYEEKEKLIEVLDKIQEYQFKLFKNEPPFDTFKIKTQIKYCIESNI